MKKIHKIILALLAVYFCLAHVTNRIEVSTLQDRSARMEQIILQQARQQQQILLNQEKSMSPGATGPGAEPWHPDTDDMPDLV